ncbi:hypothetical protein V8C86DRAFT_2491527 [Haematococcus lacustris]
MGGQGGGRARQEGRQHGLACLTLSHCQVQSLSPAMLLALAPSLRCLQLPGNTELGQEPDALPPELARLSLLQHLDLSGCGLTTLAPAVAALPALKHLDLGFNSLSALPVEMACLPTLRRLDLNHNRFPALPSCVWAATQLQHLTVGPGIIAATRGFDQLHLLTPNLRRLQVGDVQSQSLPKFPSSHTIQAGI